MVRVMNSPTLKSGVQAGAHSFKLLLPLEDKPTFCGRAAKDVLSQMLNENVNASVQDCRNKHACIKNKHSYIQCEVAILCNFESQNHTSTFASRNMRTPRIPKTCIQ